MKTLHIIPLVAALAAFSLDAHAAPKTYIIDSEHTYPSIETDHFGGLSVWRGKFNKTTGKITLDHEAKIGTIETVIDTNSVDFGNDALNEHIRAADMLDSKQFPQATYKGTFAKFNGDVPIEISGELTLRGITKPLTLTIKSFKCMPNHPMHKKEVCGADAYAVFNRGDFGVNYGLDKGFFGEVRVQIQVEAIIQQ
jgi:Uncharacterized conserved protein